MTNQPLVVAGVDTHKDTHDTAVITVNGEHIGAAEFPATDAGYRALTGFITCHGVLLRTGVEGTNSDGANLTRRALDLTLAKAADALAYSLLKISRIERGHVGDNKFVITYRTWLNEQTTAQMAA